MNRKNLILLSVLCLALSGCGGASSQNPLTSSSSIVSMTDSGILPDVEISSVASELNTSDYTAPTTGSIQPEDLFKNDQASVRAESIDADSESTYLEISVTNFTDKDMTISCMDAYINNYLISTSFNAEIPAGETILTGIDFSNANLNACDIRTIGEISFNIIGYDYATADTLFETGQMHITTDQKGTFEQTVNTSGTLLWENHDVSFILRGITHDEDFNPIAAILITNRSEDSVFADAETTGSSADSAYIDFGYMLTPGTQVLAYVRGFDAEGNLLDSLDGITYHFMLSDGDTWDDIATSDDLKF